MGAVNVSPNYCNTEDRSLLCFAAFAVAAAADIGVDEVYDRDEHSGLCSIECAKQVKKLIYARQICK